MTLTLALASAIVDAALDAAAAQGMAAMAVVVLDAGGHSLVAKRDERAALYRARIADAKAAGCLGMGMGGREVARRAASMPALYAAFGTLGPLIPVPGGVLIRHPDSRLLGAIGVSGDTADHDEACALAGIAAAGLVADTGAA